MRPACSVEIVPGQLGLSYRESLSQTKQNKKKLDSKYKGQYVLSRKHSCSVCSLYIIQGHLMSKNDIYLPNPMVLRVQPAMLDEAERSKWMFFDTGSPSFLVHVSTVELMIFSDQHKTSIVSVFRPFGLGAYNMAAPPHYKKGELASFCYF